MRMTVLASGSKGNSAIVASDRTRVLVDAGLSCRELLRRMQQVGEDPAGLSAILVTHEHQDHVAGLSVLARRLRIPVFFTEPTHRAWMRMLTPKTTMTYAQWLDKLAKEREQRAAASVPQISAAGATSVGAEGPSVSEAASSLDPALNRACDPDAQLPDPDDDCEPPELRSAATRPDPTWLPAVEYFRSGTAFSIGDIDVCPFTIPHDAADPCGFVFSSQGIRMAIATDLGYMTPNVKSALRNVDVLLLESNHDLEMLKDGPYPWSVKQRVLSRVGHLSNLACAEYLQRDYDGGAHTIILGHLSESNNAPELARISAEQAIGDRMRLLGNRIVLATQHLPLEPVEL
jgi:phosphoribosyl 1,2-cyclic phosphodiesterase